MKCRYLHIAIDITTRKGSLNCTRYGKKATGELCGECWRRNRATMHSDGKMWVYLPEEKE